MKLITSRVGIGAVAFALLALIAVVPFVGEAQSLQPRRVRTVDNERIFVDRSTLPPGMRQEMHLYAQDCYIVMLTPGDVDVTVGTEKTTGHQEAGTSWYIPKTTRRAFANVGKAPFDLIVVSLR